MRLFSSFLVLSLLACSSEPPPKESKTPDAALEPRKPTSPPLGFPSEAERRIRFEARPQIEPPPDLPKAWLRLAERLEARWIEAEQELYSHPQGKPTRHLRLKFRLFDTDLAIAGRLIAALNELKLPGMERGVPARPVEQGEIRWSANVRRLRAPNGAAREHRIELHWAQSPKPPDPLPECRRPPAVEAPQGLPAWIEQLGTSRRGRRRVGVKRSKHPKGERLEFYILYRTGEIHDEAIGRFIKGAQRANYLKQEGEGTRQRWRHPGGAQLSWRPAIGALSLGCRISGPMLWFQWSPPQRDDREQR